LSNEKVCYFDNFFENDFYSPTENTTSNLECGQIAWAPVQYFLEKRIKVWRPIDYNREYGIAEKFKLMDAPDDLFNHGKQIKIPVHRESKEEFLFIRAKKRPVIILNNYKPIEKIKEVRKGHRLNQDLCFLLPIYSAYDSVTNKLRFHNETIHKTRLLYYHNLFFLPEFKKCNLRESIVRVDRIFAIKTFLVEPLGYKLSDGPLEVLKELLNIIIFGSYPENLWENSSLKIYQEQLQNQ